MECRNRRIAFELKGQSVWINDIAISPDSKLICTANNDSTIKIRDVSTGSLLLNIRQTNSSPQVVAFSPDGKKIISTDNSNKVSVWDAGSGILLLSVKEEDVVINNATFSFDGEKIATACEDGRAAIWDSQSGKLLLRINMGAGSLLKISFSPDGKKIVTIGADSSCIIWDVINNKKIAVLKGHTHDLTGAAISPDGKKIVTASKDSTARIWDIDKKYQSKVLRGHTGRGLYSALFSSDDKYIVTRAWDQDPRVWDAKTGILIGEIKERIDYNAAISKDGKKILSISDENTVEVFSSENEEIKWSYTFLPIDSNDYFIHVPGGYYSCSKNASQLLHYVTDNQKIVSFEQLDVKYNRPDKVLEAIGNTDTALINSYRKAWEKRIKKLGIDTTAFRDGYSVPEADFANRDNIEYEQKNGMLKLRIKGIDSTYKLDRFNIWINEAPLYGQRGISIKKRNRNDIDTTITVKLSQGENRIETSITNVNGTESYRMPLYVNYTPAIKEKESLHFIGIGMDKFADSKYDLQYSSKDIRDLAIKLKEKYKENITIDTLFNENVSTEKVKALKQKLQKTSVNDKVIISYSGHGMLSKDYDYYLSTYSVNFNKPEENGLPYDELENLLDSIPARKKLMLIDACHSGEVDKEEGIAMQKMADSLGLKGIILESTTQTQHVGLKNSFELMQSLFVNVGKSTGATIISAAAGNQFALERNDLKNGVFTYSILEAMNNNQSLKISELKKIVGERVEQLTNGLQKPTSRNENIAVDWNL